MAAAVRGANNTVSATLFAQAHRFEFFQAVRLLERLSLEQSRRDGAAERVGVGLDPRSDQREIVRFRALPAFDFPAGEVVDLSRRPLAQDRPGERPPALPPEMRVAFMGLTGPNGVLPEHYTELLLQRIRHRDFALRDFLDLFNHRSISLFYRAWEKYRVAVDWERSRLQERADDETFTQSLRCLVGVGTRQLKNRMAVSDEIPLYYAGYFAHRPRSAAALGALLSDYLGMTVQVRPFCGQWLYLDDDDQTRLFESASLTEQHQRLGIDAVVGERVWDFNGRFRLRLESLDYRQFVRLMPGGDLLLAVTQLTRLYVGPEFDFEVQPVLKTDEIPICQLVCDDRGDNPDGDTFVPRLGWNTWLEYPEQSGEQEAALFETE